jgi:hypothetical protein
MDEAGRTETLKSGVTNLTQNVPDSRKRLADTLVQVDAPFEYADRLDSLVPRQREIADKLDLAKGQAPSQLEAAASDE